MKTVQKAHAWPSEAEAAQPAEAIFGLLSLSPDQIDAPAFFVDSNLCIRWMATDGADPFSTALAQTLRATASRNVFNLLLKPAIKAAVADWRSLFSFVYTNLHHAATRTGETNPDFSSMMHGQLSSTINSGPSETNRHPFLVDSCLIGKEKAVQRVFSLAFEKGTLFVIRQDRWLGKPALPVEEAPAVETAPASVGNQFICVLSARLNQSYRLAKTMLPGRFLILLGRMWDEADEIVRSLGGKRSVCSDPRLCYVFSENAGRDPIFSAICCASRLNAQMALLEEKLQAQYGWANDICLNMGIAHDADIRCGADASPAPDVTIPGSVFDQASLLSGIAGKGEIWITQTAAARLPKNLIERVVLGVDHQGKFLRQFFKRLSDFQQIQPLISTDPDMADLSVARIKAVERHVPEQAATSED